MWKVPASRSGMDLVHSGRADRAIKTLNTLKKLGRCRRLVCGNNKTRGRRKKDVLFYVS